MGQKGKGYRRNVDYGLRTMTLPVGWHDRVNQTDDSSISSAKIESLEYWKTTSYGEIQSGSSNRSLFWITSKERRREVEEVRRRYGYRSNQLTRKGSEGNGYQVSGGYYDVGYRRVGYSLDSADEASYMEGKRRNQVNRLGARDRLRLAKEKERKVPRSYDRVDLNQRRRTEAKTMWEELSSIAPKRPQASRSSGESSGLSKSGIHLRMKRITSEGRAGVVLRSGKLPVVDRRAKVVKMEREKGRTHIRVRWERESRRKSHASKKSSLRLTDKASTTLRSRGLYNKQGSGYRGEGYYGYRVKVKGTLDGSRRTMAYAMESGTVPGSTRRARVRSAENVAKTSVGTRGIRVEYCYGMG